MPSKELFLGNLGRDVTRQDIEGVFDKYGRVERCDIKNRGNGAVFAFLEFEEERDAEDAQKAENGKDMCGSSMVVEFAKGRSDRPRYGDRDGGDRRGGDRGGFRGGRGGFGGDRNGGGRSGGSDCFQCGQSGHFARDCRNGSSRGGGRDGGSRGGYRGGRESGGGGYRGGRDGGFRSGGGRDGGRDERRRSRSRS